MGDPIKGFEFEWVLHDESVIRDDFAPLTDG